MKIVFHHWSISESWDSSCFVPFRQEQLSCKCHCQIRSNSDNLQHAKKCIVLLTKEEPSEGTLGLWGRGRRKGEKTESRRAKPLVLVYWKASRGNRRVLAGCGAGALLAWNDLSRVLWRHWYSLNTKCNYMVLPLRINKWLQCVLQPLQQQVKHNSPKGGAWVWNAASWEGFIQIKRTRQKL